MHTSNQFNTPFIRKLNHILSVTCLFISGALIYLNYKLGLDRNDDRYFRLKKDLNGSSSEIL
jgi:hypothetical protein